MPAVSSRGSFLRYWVPVVLWMIFIFSLSTDVGAERHTSRIIGPILRWLVPGISDAVVDTIQHTIRKLGHLSEYAVLALLFWRAVRQPPPVDRRPWSWPTAAGAVVFAALYACTDEYHQSLVATRYASAFDVLIDTGGAALGMAALWLVGRWRQHG
jgi:VanZ family protein